MTDHMVVGRDEWQAAREELLQREKDHTRMADELARQRRELPWVAIEKEYRFDAEDGTRTLAELFDGRSQLLVYHFMFGPSYEAGCPTCSSMVDGFDGLLPHLHARDVTLLLVSMAPLTKLQAYKQGMGWSIPWVSSANTDFSFDMGATFTEVQVREQMPPDGQLPAIARQNAAASGTDIPAYISQIPAMSAFTLQDGAVYQTYATTFRGVEFLMGYYPILDRAPKGRDEGMRSRPGFAAETSTPKPRVRLSHRPRRRRRLVPEQLSGDRGQHPSARVAVASGDLRRDRRFVVRPHRSAPVAHPGSRRDDLEGRASHRQDQLRRPAVRALLPRWLAYGRSKLANLLFMYELQRRLDAAARLGQLEILARGSRV